MTQAKETTTRERLLEAAEQVFADKGFYEAAVDEIVARSGTSKGAVYFHFPSKEALFLAVMDQLGAKLLARVEKAVAPVTDPTERLDAALRATLEALGKHKSLAKLLLLKGYSLGPGFGKKRQELFGRFSALIQQLLDDALAVRGEPVEPRTGLDIDTEVAARAWLGAISEVVARWLEEGHPHPSREAYPTLRAMLLRSVGLTPPAEKVTA